MSDFAKINDLPKMDAAFARPNNIMVCNDSAGIVHGISLDLKVHEPNFKPDAKASLEEPLQALEESLEDLLASRVDIDRVFEMNMIGEYRRPC